MSLRDRWFVYHMPLQANSASYSQQDGKRVVVSGLRVESLTWLVVALVCLWPHRRSTCPLALAKNGSIMRCSTINSWRSAATSETVKSCWTRAPRVHNQHLNKCPDLHLYICSQYNGVSGVRISECRNRRLRLQQS